MNRKTTIFPYKRLFNSFYPIIPIELKKSSRSLKVEAFVDSGASISIFQAKVADKLGIDYMRGKVQYTMVGDGRHIPIYVQKMSIKIGNVWTRTVIGFSPHLGVEINLLGEKDIFDRYIITFNRPGRIVTFQAYH